MYKVKMYTIKFIFLKHILVSEKYSMKMKTYNAIYVRVKVEILGEKADIFHRISMAKLAEELLIQAEERSLFGKTDPWVP